MSDPRQKGADGNPLVILHHALDQESYGAPATTCIGPVRADMGQANSVWMIRADLETGTRLEWHGDHGDEALFVLSGEVSLDGVVCSDGGTVFVPAGTCASLIACSPARIAHFGSTDPQAKRKESRPFVIAADSAENFVSKGKDGRQFLLDFYTDGTDARTSSALFIVNVDGPSFAPPHSHTKDEIIHVLDGEIRVGTIRIGAGTSIGVAHDIRYSFRTECPTTFLNYRNGESSIVVAKGESVLETMAARRQNAA